MAVPGKAILAILAGGGKPKSGMKGGMMGKDGDEGGPEEESGESKYLELAEKAFPDQEWDDEKVSALKEFVMSCMDGGDEG